MMQIDGTLSPDESNVKATVNYWGGKRLLYVHWC